MPRDIDKIEADYVKAKEDLDAIEKELQDAQYSSYLNKKYTSIGGIVFVPDAIYKDDEGFVFLQGIQSSSARVRVEEIDEEWYEVAK